MKLAAQRALSYNNEMIPCRDGDITTNDDSIEAEDDVDGSESCGTANHDAADDESCGDTDSFEEYQYEEYEMDEEPHNFDDMPSNEGYGIFDMKMLNAFIHEVSRHAATCSAPLDLTKLDKRYGAGIDETWTCCSCHETLLLRNCKWVRSVKQRGRGYSRIQPDLNLKLAMGARVNSINLAKVIGLMQGAVGIKTMNRRNQKLIDLKVRDCISVLHEQRQEENLKKHVETCKEAGYESFMFEYKGNEFVITPGPGAMDGCGIKRAYNHQITGTETALIVQSGIAGVPLSVITSRVSTESSSVHCPVNPTTNLHHVITFHRINA